MRVMVMIKANENTEAGVRPSDKAMADMGQFGEEMVKAGVAASGEGLLPSSKGKRVRFSGARRTVIDGPFTEAKELIAGYGLWEVGSMEEAVEWVKRSPSPEEGDSEIEIRPLFESEDFGDELTPELRELEDKLRAEIASNSKGDKTMRVMVIVKANENSEAGIMPGEKLIAAMQTFNEQLVKAGVMLAADGLQPSSKGKRVRLSGERRTVIDGPFAEAKELIAGYWLWQVRSMEEAVEWVKRCPNPHEGDSEIEIRPVFQWEDLGGE